MLLHYVKEVELTGKYKIGNGVSLSERDMEERVTLRWCLDEHQKRRNN